MIGFSIFKKINRSARYKRLRTVAWFNIALLLVNLFSYFWISGSGVATTRAEEIGLCVTICETAGCDVTDCATLLSPPAPEEEEEPGTVATEEETTVIPGSSGGLGLGKTPLISLTTEDLAALLIPEQAHKPPFNEISYPGQNASLIYSSSHYFTFYGRTNIANAILVITVSSPNNIYATGYADNNGSWRWTAPEILLIGDHTLTVMAMSPSNAQVREYHTINFSVVAPPAGQVIPPPVVVPPVVEILPPGQAPPLVVSDTTYILDLNVVAGEQTINPGDLLALVADIVGLNPSGEQSVTLRFVVKGIDGSHTEFADNDILLLNGTAQVSKIIRLSETAHPGDYIATVTLVSDGIRYIATAPFTVSAVTAAPTDTLVLFPGRLTIDRGDAQRGLFTSFVFLSLLLIFFLTLLWREYQKAKKELQITGRDLWRSGQVS
jgi:hypothetical protein